MQGRHVLGAEPETDFAPAMRAEYGWVCRRVRSYDLCAGLQGTVETLVSWNVGLILQLQGNGHDIRTAGGLTQQLQSHRALVVFMTTHWAKSTIGAASTWTEPAMYLDLRRQAALVDGTK